MRKILAIVFCIICLSFCSVPARANVTNQLDEISAQLENLDHVLQWFIDNESYLDYLIDGSYVTQYIWPMRNAANNIRNLLQTLVQQLAYDVAPDIASIEANIAVIKTDLASLSLDVVTCFSQVVNSINSLTDEVVTFRSDFLSAIQAILIDTGLIGGLLTPADLDYSLMNLLADLDYQRMNMLSDLVNYFDENLYLFEQLYTAILSLENTVSEQEITVDIVVGGLSELFEDLESGLEYVLNNLNLDLTSSIYSLRSELSTIINVLEGFRSDFHLFLSDFQGFLLNWENLGTMQLESIGELHDFMEWYQGYFFDGLHRWGLKHSEYIDHLLDRETVEDEHRENIESVFYDDTQFPTDSDIPVQVVLDNVDMEEPEEPDYEINAAADKVERDMEEVSYALEGTMDEVDASVSSFIEDVNIEWGKFNSVLSFSFKPPLAKNNYTMTLSYDFSESEWLPVCRSVSTGIWGIVLFINSYLAISSTLYAVIKN